MRNDKVTQFVKRWRELQQQQSDLDYEKAVLARDIRAEFKVGEIGDQQFVGWCTIELGMVPKQAQDLLARARMLETVQDSKQWRRLGGFQALKHAALLPKDERRDVVLQAIGAGRDVKGIMRERGLIAPSKTVDYRRDAAQLAEYVAGLPSVPKYIHDIVAKYTTKRNAS